MAPPIKRDGFDGRYPHVYAMLKAAGHDAAKAVEIILDCKRRDKFTLAWVRMLRSIS